MTCIQRRMALTDSVITRSMKRPRMCPAPQQDRPIFSEAGESDFHRVNKRRAFVPGGLSDETISFPVARRRRNGHLQRRAIPTCSEGARPLKIMDNPNTCAARGATWKGAPLQPWAARSRRHGNAGKAKSRKRAIAIGLAKGSQGGE